MRALFIGRSTARSRAAAGLGRVPVHPELGEDPDRRAPPVGGLRERETDGPQGEEKEREKCWAGLGF